jgi:hypothetical protein
MPASDAPKVHIFWDNSNIFIPAKYVGARRDGTLVHPRPIWALELQSEALWQLVHRGSATPLRTPF